MSTPASKHPVLRVLDHLEEWLIVTLMALATFIIFVAVVHRYASGMPIPWLQDHLIRINLSWAQELCIFMFVWMAKFGAAYGVRKGIHVGIDVLVMRLPPRSKRVFILFALFAGAFFTAVVGTLGAKLVWGLAHTEQVSSDLELPMWWVYLCVPLGSYLMSFRFLQVLWTVAHGGEVPHHDVSQTERLTTTEAEAIAVLTRAKPGAGS